MKSNSKPAKIDALCLGTNAANRAAGPAEIDALCLGTDASNRAPDPAEIDAGCLDTHTLNPEALVPELARCFMWPDALVRRGEITEAQRRDLERVLLAILRAGTGGPLDGQWRDDLRRVLLAAAKSGPVQAKINQRRVALIWLMPDLRHVLEGPSDLDASSELDWIDICRKVRRVDPKARPLTRVIAERALDPSDNRMAERLAVALGIFGDKDPATARERFDRAVSALSRGNPKKAAKPAKTRKPRKPAKTRKAAKPAKTRKAAEPAKPRKRKRKR